MGALIAASRAATTEAGNPCRRHPRSSCCLCAAGLSSPHATSARLTAPDRQRQAAAAGSDTRRFLAPPLAAPLSAEEQAPLQAAKPGCPARTYGGIAPWPTTLPGSTCHEKPASLPPGLPGSNESTD